MAPDVVQFFKPAIFVNTNETPTLFYQRVLQSRISWQNTDPRKRALNNRIYYLIIVDLDPLHPYTT